MISVIISSYNRYSYLLKAIESVKNQTYKNYEIIVIDDGSTQKEYKKNIDNVNIIHLDKKNSRNVLGYPSCGYVRNHGFKIAKGEYICILDDDDYWLPNKLETQIKILQSQKYLICCSEAYITKNRDFKSKNLQLYNKSYWWKDLKRILELKDDFPNIFDNKFITKHNSIICSSVMFNRKVFDLVGYMPEVSNWSGTNNVYQDWDYWKKISKFSDIYYIKTPLLMYYLSKHNYI